MTEGFDKEEQRVFVVRQFQIYLDNPEIPRVIRKIWGLEQAGHDFLAAMHPLFLALRQITEFIGGIPRISEESEEGAWKELCRASAGILNDESFDEFRPIIELEFMMNLKISILSGKISEKIKERVELTFAMILRMIQIERAAGSST